MMPKLYFNTLSMLLHGNTNALPHIIARSWSLILALLITTSATAQTLPQNVDFEYGNFTNWVCYTGTCCVSGVMSFPAITSPINGRHNIVTLPATDRYGGFPVVSPGGGSYACRLGYDTTGQRAEKIRYFVHIPTGASDYSLVFHYAAVLENPSAHGVTQQPRMTINAFDSSTGLATACNAIEMISGTSMPGFLSSPVPVPGNGADVIYKPWSSGSMRFPGLGGHTMIIEFAAGDCSLNAHFGYGYVDMSGGLYASSVYLSCSSTSVTLSGPAGFASYLWCDSSNFSITYGTTQTITIAPPAWATTYALIVTSYPGFGCTDTFYTRVFPGRPIVTIQSSPGAYVCAGTTVTCTPASVINGGVAPVFKWYRNGVQVYTGASYSFVPLNSDSVYCRINSIDTCTHLPDSALSNAIVFRVDPFANPVVSIAAVPGASVCPGASVTCVPTPATGGTAPLYTWYRNSANVFTGNPYHFTPAAGDAVYAVLTSSSPCALTPSATSNTITFSHTTPGVDSVYISAFPSDTICIGSSVSISAAAVNGGASPVYEWFRNSSLVFTGNPYLFTPSNRDRIYCRLTSSNCVLPAPAVSDTLLIAVVPYVASSVSIAADRGTIVCIDSPVNCIATGVNKGMAPVYNWFKNNTLIYTGNPYTFIPAADDSVFCLQTSNAHCPLNAVSKSNTLNFETDTLPTVTISCTPGPVNLKGTMVTLTAVLSATHSSIQYQWFKNGTAIPGATNQTYTSDSISIRDIFYCQVISSGICGGVAVSEARTVEAFHTMRLYPNPNNGRFAISGDNFDANDNEVTMTIYTAAGKLVHQQTASFNGISFYSTFDLRRELPRGVYLLRLQYSLEKISFVFVVE